MALPPKHDVMHARRMRPLLDGVLISRSIAPARRRELIPARKPGVGGSNPRDDIFLSICVGVVGGFTFSVFAVGWSRLVGE